MRTLLYSTTFNNGVLGTPFRRRVAFVAATAITYGAAAYLAIALTRNATNVAAIWPANGILLAALLITSRASTRYAILASCLATHMVAGSLNDDPWISTILYPLVCAGECLLALHMLRWACGRRVDLTKAPNVVSFVMVCLIACLVPAAVGGLVVQFATGAGFKGALTTWYLSDSLGLLVITPAILLLWPGTRVSARPPQADVARLLVMLIATSLVVFFQSELPLLFLVIPISVLIAFRLGPRYTAVATLWLTFVSLACAYSGLGPTALMADPEMRVWVVQLFCFVNLMTSLAVAAEIADRDRLRNELERVSRQAADQRRQLDTALDAMCQGVCLFDHCGRVVVRNSRFLEIYGLDEHSVPTGASLADLMNVCRAAGAIPEGKDAAVELNIDNDIEQQLVDGRHIRISQRVLADGAVICTYTDFTAEKRAEAELLHRTLHDVLTGLPNRRLLVERIDQALTEAKRGRKCAVMLIDIDYFKSINDNMGHAAGDELLRLVAGRLIGCVRATDTVARLGGDEFALLLAEGEHGVVDPETVARRILDAIRSPIYIENKLVRVGISMGIAKPPLDGATTDDILKSADVALYKAKRNGRGNFAFFNADEDADACSARRLESELRRAVEDKEFRIVYQPIKSGGSGGTVALEALIRWNHPELGTISPAEFIPLAERNGLISEIGDWVLDQACRDAASLPSNIRISVNLSRVQMADPNFVTRVAETLERTGLTPDRLELEVTETAILHDEVNACQVLASLQALGISVAIDDFGVGQSALSCLRSLPIGRIKIDRSFVNDLATDAKARSIFVAVVSLAKQLGIKTTAEGIETEQQRIIAALAGCDHLQGYLLGRPQDLERLDFDPAAIADLELALDLVG